MKAVTHIFFWSAIIAISMAMYVAANVETSLDFDKVAILFQVATLCTVATIYCVHRVGRSNQTK